MKPLRKIKIAMPAGGIIITKNKTPHLKLD